MRKANAVLTALIMVLFLVHMVWGGLVMAGMTAGGSSAYSLLSYAMLVLAALHGAISLKLTADALKIMKRTGASYLKENRVYWIRRISGIALILFMTMHVLIFRGEETGGMYLLGYFGAGQLVSQILMVVSLLVHLLTNIRSLKIAFGLEDKGNFRTDVCLVLALLLLLAGLCFVVYYIRWQVV